MDPNRNEAKNYTYVAPGLVNRKCLPPFIPPADKPHRKTNLLQYLLESESLDRHQFARPFQEPVDMVKASKLRDYFVVHTRPMDFLTIKRRLENFWYYDAIECIVDFRQIFANCYGHIRAAEHVVLITRAIEDLFLDKLKGIAAEEIVLELPTKKSVRLEEDKHEVVMSSIERGNSVLI